MTLPYIGVELFPGMDAARANAAAMKIYTDPTCGCSQRIHVRKRTHLVTVPCGQCRWCARVKMNATMGEVMLEAAVDFTRAIVITLTLDDKSCGAYKSGSQSICPPCSRWHHPETWREEIDLLLRRWSRTHWKENGKNWKKRYLYVAERGEKFGRPHAHIIVFNTPEPQRSQRIRKKLTNLKADWWPYGHVTIDQCTPKSTRYVVSYLTSGKKSADVITWSKSNHLGNEGLRRYTYDMVLHSIAPSNVGASYRNKPRRNREITEEGAKKIAAYVGVNVSDLWHDDGKDGGRFLAPELPMVIEVDFKTYPLSRRMRQEWLSHEIYEPLSEIIVDFMSELDRELGEVTRDKRVKEARKADARQEEYETVMEARKAPTIAIDGYHHRVEV